MSVIAENETRQALLDRVAQVAEAALLHEAMGKRGAVVSTIRPAYAEARVCGFALPIQCPPGDNLMLHKALSVAEPGDVMIATVGGFIEAGVWGEIATVAAIQRGVCGFVTDGSVRDTHAIAGLGFGVFSAGLSIKGTTKTQKGTVGKAIVFCGVAVEPGDLVIGDADGVVIVPHAEIDATIDAAHAIQQREQEILNRIRAGALTIDLLGLRDTLRAHGLDD